MVTWIFGHYHIVHEMHSMWFSHKRYKSQVLCKFRILVRGWCEIGHFICRDYNISTKMILLGSKDLGTNVFRTLMCVVGKAWSNQVV